MGMSFSDLSDCDMFQSMIESTYLATPGCQNTISKGSKILWRVVNNVSDGDGNAET